MKKLFVQLAAVLVAHVACAATSSLLVQGPFGSGGATATFQWKVNYPAGFLSNGQDLLNAVFGTPVRNGDYTDSLFGTLPYYVAGNGNQQVGYVFYTYDGGTFFPISFTLSSTLVAMDNNKVSGTSTLGWNYYVAGGSGTYGGIYANSSAWIFSVDGTKTRQLADGSFDSWVFGDTGSDVNYSQVGSPATVAASGNNTNAPTDGNFSAATVIEVPEPSSVLLLLLGPVAILALNRRKRA